MNKIKERFIVRDTIESLLKELGANNFKLNIEAYNTYRRTGVIISSKAIKGTYQAHTLTLSDGSSTVATII